MMTPCPSPTLLFFFLLLIFFFIVNINAKKSSSSSVHQFLSQQNAARAALNLPPLKWDPTVARYARGYARSRRRDCALEHSNGPYGENLFWGSGNGWTVGQAVAAWVAERQGYDYGSNTCAYGRDKCGHYTQIVWRESKRIGCARVVCSAGKGVFITCNYDPPGNYIGERPY